jgi:hypothetical protein
MDEHARMKVNKSWPLRQHVSHRANAAGTEALPRAASGVRSAAGRARLREGLRCANFKGFLNFPSIPTIS